MIVNVDQSDKLYSEKAKTSADNAASSATQAQNVVDGIQTKLDLKANLDSPAFTGIPTTPTATAGTNTTQLASTEFVTNAINNKISVTGNAASATKLETARTISLTGDVTGSASFDGSADASITTTVADDSHNHTIGTITNLQTSLDLKAPLSSPAFTGTPTSPTATAGTNTTQIASTEFVTKAVNDINGYVVDQLTVLSSELTAETAFTVPSYTVGSGGIQVWADGVKGAFGTDSNIYQVSEVGTSGTSSTSIKFHDTYPSGTEILVRVSYPLSTLSGLASSINDYATLNSPIFTGTPKVPTATSGTNTTQIASTEFVTTAIANKTTISGNAGSSDKLSTARTIQTNLASTTSASFDGTANITPGISGILPIANGGTGNSTGLAATSTKLETARTISLTGDVTGSASFDGSSDISIAATVSGGTKSTTCTISASATATDSTITVTGVTGVTATNTIMVSPAPSSYNTWSDCGFYCSAQGDQSLTFTYATKNSVDIIVNVIIMS